MHESNVFMPGETISFDTVEKEHRRLRQFISALGEQALTVDLSGIKQCDSAGLALILEAKRLANKAQKECFYQAIPDPVLKLARFCGIETIFSTV
ncbi:MAG: STAS domain-containing protein [Legionellaceae bacterium]|nr:STAS domain-containing protein [Legionellaceae bacterium]